MTWDQNCPIQWAFLEWSHWQPKMQKRSNSAAWWICLFEGGICTCSTGTAFYDSPWKWFSSVSLQKRASRGLVRNKLKKAGYCNALQHNISISHCILSCRLPQAGEGFLFSPAIASGCSSLLQGAAFKPMSLNWIDWP